MSTLISLEEIIGEIEWRSSESGEDHGDDEQVESFTPLLVRPQQLLLYDAELNEAVAVHPAPDQLLQCGQGLAVCIQDRADLGGKLVPIVLLLLHLHVVLHEVSQQLKAVFDLDELPQLGGG